MSGIIALCTSFYSEVKELCQLITSCISTECLNKSKDTNTSNINGHVRFNSELETRIFTDEVESVETIPYDVNWTNQWTTSNRPLSPVTRSLVNNVFTRSKLIQKHHIASVNLRATDNVKVDEESEVKSYLYVMHSTLNKGEAIVMPSMVTVSFDPSVVLSRGYRMLDSESKSNNDTNVTNDTSDSNDSVNDPLKLTIKNKEHHDKTVTSVIPNSSTTSNSFKSVCNDIDEVIAKSVESLTPIDLMEEQPLLVTSTQVKIPDYHLLDSNDYTTISTHSSNNGDNAGEELIRFPQTMKKIRYGEPSVDESGLSPFKPTTTSTTTAANSDNNTIVEGSILSPVQKNTVSPTFIPLKNEKILNEDELLNYHKYQPTLPQHQYSGTIYDIFSK